MHGGNYFIWNNITLVKHELRHEIYEIKICANPNIMYVNELPFIKYLALNFITHKKYSELHFNMKQFEKNFI